MLDVRRWMLVCSSVLIFAALFCATPLCAQDRPAAAPRSTNGLGRFARPGASGSSNYTTDIVVVRDAQEDALEQARGMHERAEQLPAQVALDAAVKEMKRSLALLEEARKSPDKLPEAVAAEQAAYQALLKLAAHEYRVSRNRSGQQGGQQGERAQRQIDELDLKQTENRYEMQRQASPQQNAEQREQLQVMNRLKELAQRQQDLNARLKELQTALQEAKTDEEREEIRRRLKRLREEEQEMLADTDELRQRMERPENQSRMADARQQLDKTRSDVQRASEALDDSSVPQALTAGTRAQRQLQQIAEDFRKKTSNQFSDQMRQMRNEARQLAQKQEELAKQLDELANAKQKTLSDSDERKDLAAQLGAQKAGLTNLFNQMRGVSEQSETAEPLLSKQLYDTLRQSNQEELNKSLDLSAELVQRGFVPQAGQFEQRARQTIDALKSSVEKAAESVLGDDVESLRLAKRELDSLSQQLERELAQADTNAMPGGATGSTNEMLMQRHNGRGVDKKTGAATAQAPDNEQKSSGEQSEAANREGENEAAQNSKTPNGDLRSDPNASSSGQRQSASAQQAQNGPQGSQNEPGNSDQQSANGGSPRNGQAASSIPASPGSIGQSAQRDGARGGSRRNFYEGGGANGGGAEGGGYAGGVDRPLTGDNFVDWSDRLRDVEEMLDLPELRSEVARVRDRARAVRFQYKRHAEKPDWAVVRLQMVAPLAEVRSRIGEELARRESNEAVVPIDRDPVPTKFSELVRRYYEQLGKE
jgi:hypothetical protein